MFVNLCQLYSELELHHESTYVTSLLDLAGSDGLLLHWHTAAGSASDAGSWTSRGLVKTGDV